VRVAGVELEVARQLDPGNPHIARELDELARPH
jgi:hypothetical protein